MLETNPNPDKSQPICSVIPHHTEIATLHQLITQGTSHTEASHKMSLLQIESQVIPQRPQLLSQNKASNNVLEPNSTPDQIQPICSETQDVYVASTKRHWPGGAIDRFVIGRIYGGYNLTASCHHLRLVYDRLADITNAELDNFWNFDLAKTNIIQWWSSKNHGDVEVNRVQGNTTQTILVHVETELDKKERGLRGMGEDRVLDL